MNKRQKQIIEFAKKNHSFQNKDVVVFFDDKYSRETITRDLSFLSHQKFLHKSGAGAFVAYSLSDTYSSLEEVDIQKYFETPYFQRDVKEIFNFEIFHILGNDIFTAEEKEKLEKLQRQFINNFSK